MFTREVLIGIVIGFALAYLYNLMARKNPSWVPPFPVVTYDRATGVGLDWKSTPFNWTNPSR